MAGEHHVHSHVIARDDHFFDFNAQVGCRGTMRLWSVKVIATATLGAALFHTLRSR